MKESVITRDRREIKFAKHIRKVNRRRRGCRVN